MDHHTGTRDEWLDARLDLLEAEKELTRLNDDLARRRKELPRVRIDKEYRFDTEDGEATLTDLFHGRTQLIVYHFMYAPHWDEGCPSCSGVADGFDETHLHLQNHDVAFTAVSRAPLEKLLAYRDRMGWSFPWASSALSDFNFDFNVSFTEESVASGQTYNFRPLEGWQLDPGNLPYEGPGMSAFELDDGVVYHTYSAYSRGVDALWNMWQWLDRAPLGRNEGDVSWFRRHDQYEASYR
ncbi:MAG TPA: thioredoxin family protein [Acidimicrobiales bacterium]|nr:thioredoxin family protein [Acidimicrobiales bacterium]